MFELATYNHVFKNKSLLHHFGHVKGTSPGLQLLL